MYKSEKRFNVAQTDNSCINRDNCRERIVHFYIPLISRKAD